MITYLATLLSTIGIELAVIATARRFVPSLRKTPVLATCLCINLVTHPLATLARITIAFPILPLEVGIVAIEAIGFWQIARVPKAAALMVSLIANVMSFLFGLLLLELAIATLFQQ